MNFSNYRFTLDIQSNQSQISLPVLFGDTSRRLYINLTDSGNPYLIEDGCRAVFAARKPDGHTVFNDCPIEDNTKIRYDFTANTASAVGTVECEIRLYGPTGRLITTPRFIMVVDERVIYDDDIIFSDSEKTTIDAMLLSETERVANEETRKRNEAERETAEARRTEAFNEAVMTATRAKEIADGLEQKLSDGNFDGSSVFIRYSAYSDGTGYTEAWSVGQSYIGIAVAKKEPTDKSGYVWTLFHGDMSRKLDKRTDIGAERVYAITKEGEQQMKGMAVGNASRNTLVLRNGNGNAGIETPTENWHIANKGYVDGVRAEMITYGTEDIGENEILAPGQLYVVYEK